MPRTLLLAACLSALPALAFEGVIDMKMTIAGKPEANQSVSSTGTITMSIKGLSSRMDSSMKLPGVSTPLKTTVIHRADEPNTTYLVYEANKTYDKMDSKADADVDHDASKATVKRLGKENIAGRPTEHVLVTEEGGREMELWIDTTLISSADLEKAFGTERRGGSWWGALKKAGVTGIPLKFVSKGKEAHDRITTEATRVESKSISSSLFQVPAGYTESKGGGLGPMSADQQKELMKSYMDKMSPADRQKMEERMKKAGGGQ
jgi:hypothetical protein